MKATGIVRRIDDLGRIVIPKEIRRTMRIREGDPREIFTDNNGEVIFKKYSAIGEMGQISEQLAEAINRQSGLPVVILDRDHCVAAAGVSKKEVLERRVAVSAEEIMEDRAKFLRSDGANDIKPLEGVDRNAEVISTVISAGDVAGAVVLLDGDKSADASDTKLCDAAASFFGLQMEE